MIFGLSVVVEEDEGGLLLVVEIDFWLKGTSLVGAIIEILIWLLLVLRVD